jgi:pimeloyl-ACP methyl ester carboxylesterase
MRTALALVLASSALAAGFSPSYSTLALPTGANLSCLFAGMPWQPSSASSTPVLLFLHGFPEGSWAWSSILATGLLDSYVLVAPDQRGYNASSLMSSYALPQLVEDATSLAAALSVSSSGAAVPVHWVAHDWGGAVAWAAAAADDGALIASLTIINMAHPLGWITELRAVEAQQAASSYVLSFINPSFPAFASADSCAFLQSIFSSEPWWPAARAAYLASWQQQGTVSASLGWYRDNVRPHCNLSCTAPACWQQGVDSSFDHLANGGKTRASLRVRVLWGLLDSAFDDAGQLAFLAKVVQGPLNITTYPKNGHWLANEQPEAVAAAIAEFVGSAA